MLGTGEYTLLNRLKYITGQDGVYKIVWYKIFNWETTPILEICVFLLEIKRNINFIPVFLSFIFHFSLHYSQHIWLEDEDNDKAESS